MTRLKTGARTRPGPFHSTNKVHWIPDFIRKERVRQGLTQAALSKELGKFPARHIAKYETGVHSVPAVYALEKILYALGYELRIHKRIEMNQIDWLKRTAKKFPKMVKVKSDLKSSDIKAFFGQEFVFARVPFRSLGYCILGFKDEYTLTTFCKKFAKHLISEGDQA